MKESLVIAAGAALSAFSGDSQHNRLMRLDFPFEDGPPAILLPNTLAAHEEISRGFRILVDVLSDDPRIPLKILMGRMVTISLVRHDGSLRYFNGYITEFRFLRTDGGFAFYQMVLEPWLAFARLRKDNVSFHGKNVREITEETLKHYRQADWHMHSFEDDPQLTVANQHNETDYNHLHRRWEARGLHYWYEHRFDGHTLMLSDKSFLAEPIDATRHDDPDVIPFRDKSGSLEDDGIREWTAIRRLGSGKTTLVSSDYKNPGAQHASFDSTNAQGDVFPYEVYENTGSYGFRMRSDGERLAAQRMVEQDKDTQCFEAAGNDRSVMPGRTFKLGGHFSAEPRSSEYDPEPRRGIGERAYLILTVDHEASNNYQAGQGASSHYENRFTCIRKDIRWRPGRNYHSEPATYMGLHTAIVVGPAGADIHTDGYGRVKVQFHWDRLGTYDENSSPWIRVMTPAAGNEFGHVQLPRVGQEVAVVYPDGNIDHPLILGAVYNGDHMPPWELPEQQALSGLRSRELGADVAKGRGNHLVLDDTAGKLQAQLKSDHKSSQLSLGHITRIENTVGRKDFRGEGWELRTDGHGVLRSAEAMLITTERRSHGQSYINDMEETIDRLTDALELHAHQAKNAISEQAQEWGHQDDIADKLDIQNQNIRKSSTQSSETSVPNLILASAAGLATSTAQSTHISSGEHVALTAKTDVSIVAGDSLFTSVAETLRLFAKNAGMKLLAAAGKISIIAKKDDIELIAAKVLTLVSEAEWIDIKGKKGIRLHGAGSMLEISDRVKFFTSSPTQFYGNLETLAPSPRPQSYATTQDQGSAAMNSEDEAKFDEQFQIISGDGITPIADRRYRITADDGQTWEGRSDSHGLTQRVVTSSSVKLSLTLLPD